VQLQLLLFGALAFCLLILSGYYPAELRAINLDTDWFYRKGGHFFYRVTARFLNGLNSWCHDRFIDKGTKTLARFAESAPIILVVWLLTPILKRKNKDVSNENLTMEKVRDALITASIPIGISAAAAALFFVGLFFLMAS